LEDREATLTQKDDDRSAEWDKKMREVQERQDALAKEEKERAESYEKRLQEAEVAKKEEEQKSQGGDSSEATKPSEDDEKAQAEKEKEKEAEIQRKLDDLKSTEQKIAADRASLGKSKADFTAKLEWFQKLQKSFEDEKSSAQHDAVQAKKDLEQRYKEVEGQKPSAGKKVSYEQDAPKVSQNGQNGTASKKNPQDQNTAKAGQTGQNGTQNDDLQRKQRENADLEKRLAKLEDQLAHMSASEGKSEKSKVNGTANKGSEGCGYKHYKPPRKLNRKVIGIVYA
jgi:hypothetical protein